ncbi:hypothetical protein PENTCL1PPCAC_4023, partial [Pristionchus entomophagus]
DPRINVGLLWLTLIPGIPYLVYLLRDVSFIWGLAAFALLPVIYTIGKRALHDVRIVGLDKRAVFISGCDSGFGNLLALKCARQGMPVFAGCMTEKGAEALRVAAAGLPGPMDTLIMNVTSSESVAAAAKYLDQATEKYGGLHGVVNNAGILGATYLDDFLSVEQYKEVAEVNTFGVIRVTQALKHLVKKTRGRIVTISSAAARVGNLGWGPYTTSKFAVSGYCEVVRQELRFFGVSLHILEPGVFRTPMADAGNIEARFVEMWNRAKASAKQEYGEEYYREFRKRQSEDIDFFGSTHLDFVVDAYFHALTARFPQLRYQLGKDCHYFYIPMSYMPTGMRDAIFTLIELV